MPETESVGRIVHYVAYGTPGGEYPEGVCRAAIITKVWGGGDVGLAILNPTGMFFNERIEYSPLLQPGTWHWPERV